MASDAVPTASIAPQGPELSATARWWGGRVFELQVRDHRFTIDSSGREGPAAMEAVLGSLAACLGSMVADILELMRIPHDGLEVRVRAFERADTPRTFRAVEAEVCLSGVPREKAERAVLLAESKYCPVTAIVRDAGADLRVKTVVVDEPHPTVLP